MGDDPGWPWEKRNRGGGPKSSLVALRIIFSAFVTGVTLFGLVSLLTVSGSKKEQPDQSIVVPLILLGITVVLVVVAAALRKPLDASDESTLATSYRGKVIIRAAIAEGAALLGIVGFMATGQWWMAPVVLVIAVVGFAATAPTAAAVEREQQLLIAQGSPLSLTTAMLNAPVARR